MDYSVSSADLDRNRDDIISLWRRNFPDLPQERYNWIYQSNPHGKALSWLAREIGSGSLVGTTSLFPRKMNVNGKSLLVGVAGDFAVNQEHRGFNTALKLQRAVTASLKKNNFEFIYGISNKKAEPVQLRAGYVVLGKMDRWAKLLKTSKYFKTPVSHRLVSTPLDSIMKVFSREARYRRAEGYTIQRTNSFDQRFDLLWEKASKQFNIIEERSKEYLNWRYDESPHKNYHIFSVVEKDNQEVWGYIVYYLEGKTSFIADMLFLDFGLTLESLLSEFVLYLRDQDVESISILLYGCPSLAKKLKSFGFFRREEESKVLVYVDENSSCRDLILNGDNWLLLEGDGDM